MYLTVKELIINNNIFNFFESEVFFLIRCMECIDTKFVQCNWCGQDASCQEPKSGCPSPISVVRFFFLYSYDWFKRQPNEGFQQRIQLILLYAYNIHVVNEMYDCF
jgi:hypothetical protein